MSSIKFEHIDKIYDNGFQAVFDFNMEVEQGEFVVFVGPSGCGKSTMMRVIAGLEEITEGKIYFDGECVNQKTPHQRGIAMVFQSYALYPHLNVYDNMAFALMLDGYDEDYIDKRVKETAAILGLSNHLERRPRELSGGQCQRVAVGRAIIRKPKVFLMDEPLSNLDAKQRVTMRSEIIDIHRKTGATTIYVTHDQVEAMTMADRIVIMRDGRIQQVGTPHDLYFDPSNRFVGGFVGEPPMNFIDCVVKDAKLQVGEGLSIELASFKEQLAQREGKVVTFGFRPEAAVLGESEGVQLVTDVETSELLGDSANVYSFLCGHRIILKVAPHLMPRAGAKFSCTIPYECVYLFEGEHGERIR